MQRITFFLGYMLFASVAQAATVPQSVLNLVGVFSGTILNPIIAILFALALASFFYGIVLYIWNPGNEELRETGKRSMFWGVVGMTIMVSAFGILNFLISSIGADSSIMNNV